MRQALADVPTTGSAGPTFRSRSAAAGSARDRPLDSPNPADTRDRGRTAGPDRAPTGAVEAARRAFPAWSATPAATGPRS